jgi:putative membrane protein
MMGYGYGPQWGMMGGYGFGLFHMIAWVIVLIALLALAVWLARSLMGPAAHHQFVPRRSAGLDVLEERYARGEINRDEFLQKKRDIGD